MERIKCLIIGSGPAGYTAAIYASRSGLKPVVYEGPLSGGQLTQTSEIENFPGYPDGVNGFDLMEDLRKQAARLGADIRFGTIEKVDFSTEKGGIHIAYLEDGSQIEAQTVIISTGASAKYLGLSDEKKYAGMGVSACATCDGFFYRKKVVAVVGGGDTACEEAQYLSHLASKVYLIVRRNVLRASEAMQQKVKSCDNIEILWDTQTVGLFGENGVEGAHLVKYKGTDKEEAFDISIDGFFLAIGHHPNTEAFLPRTDENGILHPGVEVDKEGYIIVNHPTTATNIPGVFAAGDVADPIYRQAISAAGSGCHAAMDAERYLNS
ncbi:MAG: thioredoxin-disulfide reductase [Bacteroidales bacterium]|nr:thioredoxin-disulfide reductase [Bacteroidales bacterium]